MTDRSGPVDRVTWCSTRSCTAAPLCVFGYDRDGICFFSEGAGAERHGRHPGELVGTNLWDYFADDPDLVERMTPTAGAARPSWRPTGVGDRTFDTWYLPLAGRRAARRRAAGHLRRRHRPGPRPRRTSQLYRAFVDAAPQFIALARLDGSVLLRESRAAAGWPASRRRRRHRDHDRGLPDRRGPDSQHRGRAARRRTRRPLERRDHPAALADRRGHPGPGRLVPRHRPGDRRAAGAGHRAGGHE